MALFGYLYQIEDLIERFRPARDFFFRNRGEAEVRGVELEGQCGQEIELEVTGDTTRRVSLVSDTIALDNAIEALRCRF